MTLNVDLPRNEGENVADCQFIISVGSEDCVRINSAAPLNRCYHFNGRLARC